MRSSSKLHPEAGGNLAPLARLAATSASNCWLVVHGAAGDLSMVAVLDESRVFRRDFCLWRRVESEGPLGAPADMDTNRSKFDFRPSPLMLLQLLLLPSPFPEEGRVASSLADGGREARDTLPAGLEGGATWGTAVKHSPPVAAHARHAPGSRVHTGEYSKQQQYRGHAKVQKGTRWCLFFHEAFACCFRQKTWWAVYQAHQQPAECVRVLRRG